MEPDFEKLKNGDEISIGLIIHDGGSQPEISVRITNSKAKESKMITFMPAKGVTGNLEFFHFKVGKKKRQFKFPYEIESMEFSVPPVFKATLKKRESD